MKTKIVIGILSVLAVTSSAFASFSTNTAISDLVIEGNSGFARLALAGTVIGGARPACHNTIYTVHYGFDTSSDKGKALLATATAAMLAGKLVQVTGTGACVAVNPSLNLEAINQLVVFK